MPFSGHDPADEAERVGPLLPEWRLGEAEAVVDHGERDVRMGRCLVPADRHEPGRRVGQQAVGIRHVEPAMERRHDRHRCDPREEQVDPLQVAVDDVELASVLEDAVERQLHERQGFACVADRSERLLDGLDMPSRHDRVAARERRDVVAAPVELRHKPMHDPLGAAVRAGRDALEGRCDLGDPQSVWQRGLPGTQVDRGPHRGPRS